MSRALIAALGKLRQVGEGRLAGSALSVAQRRALEAFARQAGCVRLEPKGRGIVYQVTDPDRLEQHFRKLSPRDHNELDDSLPNRAVNIATARSSKSAGHAHDTSYLLLKAGPGRAEWRDGAGHRLDLRAATDQLGAAALALNADNCWATEGRLWLVENQALFDRLDWLPHETDSSVAYYSGQLSTGLLDWLAERPRAGQVLFFPDYDGVGLLNYARLKKRLGDRVVFWLMPNWPARLKRYGNAGLWQSTLNDFLLARKRLSTLPIDSTVQHLMNTMQQCGLALEQEAVWL